MPDSKELKVIEHQLKAAEKRLSNASQARRNLPPGSSRARVTTANARWSAAAEEYQRKLDQYTALKEEVIE